MEDIEISKQAKLDRIEEVAKKLNIDEDDIECYGKYKAKISNELYQKIQDRADGKLILVTAINPTPMGEGKTTVSIALNDAINRLEKQAILTLREPSLGPVFGLKGGATGGGYAQVAPMDEINLHFTGDMHAITAANNLLASIIDNHIYFGNSLDIQKVVWKRCLDINDRQLRLTKIGLANKDGVNQREEQFEITAASEIMAILCLAESLEELKEKIGNIVVAYNSKNEPIFARNLHVQGALTAILKDALKPNLVQTLENNPVLIHGGPFANIAHGCNSVIATKMALKLSDYVVTEAGFGADLGAEKFLNIKCRKAGILPDVIVIVATSRAIKYHGGYDNLFKHIDSIKNKFGLNVVVAINRFLEDSQEELEDIKNTLRAKDVECSIVEGWEKGGAGALDLAQKVIEKAECPSNFKYLYNLEDSIESKIENIAKKIYGAQGVNFDEQAINQIKEIERLGFAKLPICIAKTQYSLSDNPKNLDCMEPFTINIREVRVKTGAGFIVCIAGNMMTMPGLPKNPLAEKIDIDENNNIVGIS